MCESNHYATHLKLIQAIISQCNWMKIPHGCINIMIYVLIYDTWFSPTYFMRYDRLWGFPGSSAGKESTCNAGDAGSIPGLGKCPGEGVGYPLQDSWAYLVPQTVKNPPAMWETLVRSLAWEDPLEEHMATHCRILAWRIPTDRGAWRLPSTGSQSWTRLSG